MEESSASTPPIINCHTHVFTVKDVPPRLARTIAPWPLHYLIHTGVIAGFVKWWTDTRYKIVSSGWYKRTGRFLYKLRMGMKRYFILRLIKIILFALIIASIFHDQYTGLLKPWLAKNGIKIPMLDTIDQWLADSGLIIITGSWVVKVLVIIVFLLLFPVGRNILFAILRQFSRFFKLLPGKQSTELLKRYINIVRFANYKDQFRVYSRLKLQYPPGSRMVVLPMDMEFMGAGKPARSYKEQMEGLASIKERHPDEFYPFVFVDPRRIQADKDFFSYSVVDRKVILGDCFIRDYIETKGFSGFKIYPALGYYPFDEHLLPLWKYAADNAIPIMTHCIRGVIYYRGRKSTSWDYHPVFEEEVEKYRPMLLKQMKAVDVQEIFTHPMNYVCLYKKELLAKLIGKSTDEKLKLLFGYQDGEIKEDLDKLKICFGHFGGEDEWAQFFEKDRTNYGHQLIREPDFGIDFLYTEGELKPGKPEQLWKTADWYSIICSLMLQHPNVYADISYILHGDLQILPLLRSTLQHPVLKTRVLYGSDFYVVRNHKSDKNMLADIRGGLLRDEFDLIARKNPINYLQKNLTSKGVV